MSWNEYIWQCERKNRAYIENESFCFVIHHKNAHCNLWNPLWFFMWHFTFTIFIVVQVFCPEKYCTKEKASASSIKTGDCYHKMQIYSWLWNCWPPMIGGVARKGKIETIISQSPTSSICVWFVLPRSHVLTSIQFKSMIKTLAIDVYRKDVCSASLHMCIFTFSWCKVPWQNTKQSLNRMTMNKKENNLKNRVFLHCLALAWFLEAMENVHIINKYSAQSNALEPHFWDEKNSWNCFCI